MMRDQANLAKQVNRWSLTCQEFRFLLLSRFSPTDQLNLPQIAPYFVLMLNDTIALEHEKVNELATVSFVEIFHFWVPILKKTLFSGGVQG